MRVLQVHNHYRQRGGEDAVASAESDLLRSAGHDVLEYRAENPVDPLPAAAALASAPWNPRSARRVAEVVKTYRPDVAHVHNTWYALSPSVLGALQGAGVPVVLTLHNYRLLCSNAILFRDGHPCRDCVGSHPWHGVVHRCYRGSVVASTSAAATIAWNRARGTWERDVDLYLALSRFAAEQFALGGLPPGKLRVKPNFVTDPGPREAPPSESRLVLYVGRLSEEKGIDRLVGSSDWFQAQGLELVVVGDGPLRPQLLTGPEGGIRLVGALPPDEVTRLMRRARALLFPSVWYEGQPMVILEAMAAGLPVLGSDLGAISELLAPLGNEWLVPATTGSQTWLPALPVLLDDGRVDKAGRLARETYEARFTPAIALAELEDVYRSVG